mmetsp:Transcript_102462/g.182001  ORF Transcript_102462/g.182001 Transcript_102462/m.182001 type:complete len:246 (+) Transcript_102462:45-782(+)
MNFVTLAQVVPDRGELLTLPCRSPPKKLWLPVRTATFQVLPALVACAVSAASRTRRKASASTDALAGRRQAALSFGLSVSSQPSIAEAKELKELGNEKFGMQLPEGFSWNGKWTPFQTHLFEQRVSAQDPYGKWTIGVTVDPVSGTSVEEVGTVTQIADVIANTEREKDGNNETQVVSATVVDLGVPSYQIEYKTDTSRGAYRYLTTSFIANKLLYTATSQALESQWPELEKTTRAAWSTLRLKP